MKTVNKTVLEVKEMSMNSPLVQQHLKPKVLILNVYENVQLVSFFVSNSVQWWSGIEFNINSIHH